MFKRTQTIEETTKMSILSLNKFFNEFGLLDTLILRSEDNFFFKHNEALIPIDSFVSENFIELHNQIFSKNEKDNDISDFAYKLILKFVESSPLVNEPFLIVSAGDKFSIKQKIFLKDNSILLSSCINDNIYYIKEIQFTEHFFIEKHNDSYYGNYLLLGNYPSEHFIFLIPSNLISFLDFYVRVKKNSFRFKNNLKSF